jgi:hypothetical protein
VEAENMRHAGIVVAVAALAVAVAFVAFALGGHDLCVWCLGGR